MFRAGIRTLAPRASHDGGASSWSQSSKARWSWSRSRSSCSSWMPRPPPLSGSVRWRRRHGATSASSPSLSVDGLVSSSGSSSILHVRGKKTRTTVKLDDLPQGALPLDPRPLEDDGPSYPTVVLQARRNMDKFDNCVLLTRVGGFYELYFDQAEEFGPLLNLKVAQKKTNAGPVPMAGFPFFQLDRFLKVLVQDLNRYVAVAEEFPNNAPDKVKSGGLMHDRRVARIITPGTLIDENFMDPYANNYVMAIHVQEHVAGTASETASVVHAEAFPLRDETVYPVAALSRVPLGLAWLDLSTGRFFTQSTDMSNLASILSRVGPREIVLSDEFKSQKDHDLFSTLAEDRHLITYAPEGEHLSLTEWSPMLETDILVDAQAAFTGEEVAAGSLLLHYVEDRLQGLSMKLSPPLRHENMQIMNIDKNSMRSLEIKQTMRDGAYRGSLLHAIRRTVTKSGTRLLSEWLSSPSTSLDVITARQDLVDRFISKEDLRDGIITLLRRTHDSQRLVQKFALGRGDADDLLGLASTIRATQDIESLLLERTKDSSSSNDNCLSIMSARLNLKSSLQLADRIRTAIDEEGIVQQHQIQDSEEGQMLALAQKIVDAQGSADDASVLPKSAAKKKKAMSIREYYAGDNEAWIMKPEASYRLGDLHAKLNGLLDEKVHLEEKLRADLKAPSLTLRWTPGLGHICHVKGKDATNVKDVRAISSSRTTRSFHLPEWTQLGQRLDHARAQIRAEEQVVFRQLREQVVRNLVTLRRNAAVLDELDVATSFAKLALEQGLTRPLLNDSTAHVIIGGRHPTVEGGLHEQGRTFVRNDCHVGGGGGGSSGKGSLWLITGPNMAGKSTFLRQNALITILAQVGCYVPADHASLGIVDAVFSRVGSADNLYRDQSTFMVEMLETAQILRAATPRSFVVMDEIGRGTTPEDGAAVGYAALHHLVTVNRCRTLFATHFHAIADLAAADRLLGPEGRGVEAYCTDVEEDGQGGFYYVHKLRRGINRQSHALKVARLAGLPEAAIEVARRSLGVLENGQEGIKSKASSNDQPGKMAADVG